MVLQEWKDYGKYKICSRIDFAHAQSEAIVLYQQALGTNEAPSGYQVLFGGFTNNRDMNKKDWTQSMGTACCPLLTEELQTLPWEEQQKAEWGADTNSTKESPSCPWGPLLREQCCPGMGPRETEESLEGIQNTAKQSAVAEMLALLWTKGWTTDLQQCRFLL